MFIVYISLLYPFYYIKSNDIFHPIKSCDDVEKLYCVPRVIWTCWNKEEKMKKDLLEMVEVSKKSLSNFTFFFLTEKNVSLFLDNSSFPKNFHKLREANKADYIRICLLEKYGGAWIDVMYINSGVEMEWLFSEILKSKCQFFGFKSTNPNWDIEVSFIGGPENSLFLKKFKEEYDKALNSGVSLYIKKTCRKLNSLRKLIKMRCQEYFLLDLLFTKITFTDPVMSEKVLRLPCRRSHVRVANECGWKTKCIHDKIFLDPNGFKKYPFIKLTNIQRLGIKLGDRNAYRRILKEKNLRLRIMRKFEKGRKKKIESVMQGSIEL